MKRFLSLAVLFAVTAVFLTVGDFAQAEPRVELGSLVVKTFTVRSLNREELIAVLEDPKGEIEIVEVSRNVENWPQVDIGDKVKVEYYESISLLLAPPDPDMPERSVDTETVVAPPGGKPGIKDIDVINAVAEVTAIDRENRYVTVKGPLGHSIRMKVPETVEGFDTVKVGDKVHARYTESYAVSVTEVE
jgi:hypothetical protein